MSISKMDAPRKMRVKFRNLSTDTIHEVRGREAWALLELCRAGVRGCTPVERPAPRWSGYVHDLREIGLNIETIYEPHTGLFAGTHGRYVLCDQIEILECVVPEVRRTALHAETHLAQR